MHDGMDVWVYGCMGERMNGGLSDWRNGVVE